MNRIAYIATREPDYSRVSIIRDGLNQHFEVDEYVSQLKSYKLRLFVIAMRVIWATVTGRLRKSDAVFVGFFAQPIFPMVRFLFRGPVIADAYFSLYDTMVNDKAKASSESLVGRTCFWLDRYMLRKADLCFTDTLEHVEYLKSNFNVENADVRRLWISAESQPLETTAKLNSPAATLKVFFWGGFIPLQGIDTIIRAANELKHENVKFTVFGAGQTFEEANRLHAELGINNLEFKGWKKPEAIAVEAAQSHLALGIFGTTEKAGRVIPNKAYEALAMGIPLITRDSAAAQELLTDGYDCLLVEAGNHNHLADKIRWVRDNYDQAKTIAAKGKQMFEDVCSPREVGEILGKELNAMKPKVTAVPCRSEAKIFKTKMAKMKNLET